MHDQFDNWPEAAPWLTDYRRRRDKAARYDRIAKGCYVVMFGVLLVGILIGASILLAVLVTP